MNGTTTLEKIAIGIIQRNEHNVEIFFVEKAEVISRIAKEYPEYSSAINEEYPEYLTVILPLIKFIDLYQFIDKLETEINSHLIC